MTTVPARLLALLGLLALPAFAQDEGEPEPQLRYQAVTEIDIEGVDVTGALRGPDGALISHKPKSHFEPLVNMRAHFDREIVASVSRIR